jgi:hypothetical protein
MSDPKPDPYPEHTRLLALGGANQTVGDFITWLNDHGYAICEWSERVEEDDEHEYRPAGWVNLHRRVDSWIAQYFEINPAKIDAEKRAMLDLIRSQNEAADAR